MKFEIKLLGILLSGLLLIGCVSIPTFRAHPKLDLKMKTIKSVVVMPPKIDVYQLSTWEVKEIDEWSDEAEKNVMAAIYNELENKRDIIVQPLSEDILPIHLESSIEETQALFDAVSYSIVIHTYGPNNQRFSEKIANFDYSLGLEVKELAKQADALFFIRGTENISTKGRVALKWMSAIFIPTKTGLYGLYKSPDLGGTAVTMSMSLVDADTGEILWYNFRVSKEMHDLRDPSSASGLVKELLKNFSIHQERGDKTWLRR